MFTITFRFETGNPVVIDANPGEKLLDVARKANVAIDAPCSGNGCAWPPEVWTPPSTGISPGRSTTPAGVWPASPPSPATRRSRSPTSPPPTAAG